MSYRELKNGSRPLTTDFHSKTVATRLFRVDNPDPIASRAEVDLVEGGINSVYPGAPGVLVDSISSSPLDGSVNCDVVYNYSNDRRASLLPKVNKDKLFYYTFRESITSTEVSYPYAKREPHNVPGTGVGDQPPVSKKLWTLHNDRTIVESRSQVWINVTVSGWDMTKRNAVNAQVNKLHNLGNAGVFYLFRGGEIVPRADSSSSVTLYDVTYTWLGDPGYTAILSGYNGSELDFPRINRPPWHEWVAQPGADPELNGPTYYTVPKFSTTDAPNGWTTLPGIPAL